jgi:tRNA (adenine57-N1/adenine58-N1)-methyltransferase
MPNSTSTVQPGDLMLVYRDEQATYLVAYRPGGRFECHHGLALLPDPLRWGDVIRTNREVPLYVLRPTHAEVMALQKRRTTVVYAKEAGRIIVELGVRAGGRYGECGSGSGALTGLLASLVGPTGRVYSRDRDPHHLEQARRNIDRLGLTDRVEFELRDPARSGFGVDQLDGLFVDVPEPWTLAEAGAAALAGGAPWVSLSPTVDQIVRTERALFDAGFVRRRMIEVMEREWKLFPGRTRPGDRMVGHTAFLLAARKVLDRSQGPVERNR